MRVRHLLVCFALGCGSDGKVPGTAGDPLDSDPPEDGDSGPTDGGGDEEIEVLEGVPSTTAWRRRSVDSPGSVAFTELFHQPASEEDTEWVELHNPMVLDMDVSGWQLTGAVDWTFPEGTRIPAGGFVVVAADPSALEVDALGPWSGRLANEGERLELLSRSGRRIDSVAWGSAPCWSVLADGSGFSLSKRDHDAASDRAENWTASTQPGGSPGASNVLDPLAPPELLELVPEEADWSVDTEETATRPEWSELDYDDADWAVLQAPITGGEAETVREGTVWATADNYYAVYAGAADGSDLRLLGEDTDGSWTTVDALPVELSTADHLFVAAWELTGDSSSPQMVIAELESDGDLFGTDATHWEWVLGAPGDNPQALPAGSPPDEATLSDLIADADLSGAWALPGAEQVRTASPWGSQVGGSFTDAARFIWADTFASASITNSDDTYALFRSIDPALSEGANGVLDRVPVTTYLRTPFDFPASPAAARLWLSCTVDDGLAVYLNGTEVHRDNLPAGSLDGTTLASSVADPARELAVELSTAALVRGDNLLAVEVHQATRAAAEDFVFACSLTAELTESVLTPPVQLSELPGAEDLSWVELRNTSGVEQELSELVLATSGGVVSEPLEGRVGPGDVAVVEPVGLELEAGDRLFLRRADGAALLDGLALTGAPQARSEDGAWLRPSALTPGEENVFDLTEDIVIHELMYHRAPRSEEGQPFAERAEEWLELFNRGESAVDLSGWTLNDAISFEFPRGTTLAPGDYLVVARDADALRTDWPDIEVVGDFSGSLSNSTDRVLLRDAWGNPADELRYFDGGRWPSAADGGGSSLELRDPWADNAAAEAWAASDESARTEWTEVVIRGEATPSAVGPDGRWNELNLGMLDAGILLIDDLSVLRDPDGAAEELVANGSFDADTDRWRLRGTHRHSRVVSDPDDPSNAVLRLVATGPTGHMHNQLETTLTGSTGSGEVEVSFRARWVEGSNQLHSRLYFNRLPTTSLIPQPERSGTPGAENSVGSANIGPTWSELAQDVAVPEPGQSVRISVALADPDGVAEARLWSSVDGAPFTSTPMTGAASGRFSAELAGQSAGSLVHFYVEATDGEGVTSFAPAEGPDARALYTVQDGAGSTTGLHDLRILMTEADTDRLHQDIHLMSNDPVGATVVYRESEVFYDVGVRLKGSQRGRPTAARVGYGIRFRDDQPFRGSHTSVMIDRSEGVGYGQREVLLNLAMTRVGAVSGEHNDLVQLMAPRSAYTGPAELQLDRFSSLVLDAQFEDGGEGGRFEYELVYFPLSTDDDTEEGNKLPQPDSVQGTPITWLGSDPERWRWIFLIKNNLRRDDYSAMQDLGDLFSGSSASIVDGAEEVLDVDQWLHAFAIASLAGVTDQYGGVGSQHNAQFYVRPSDGRVLYFPHDLDFYSSATMSVVGNGDLAVLLSNPDWERVYYRALLDLIRTGFTTDHLQPWCDQLTERLPGQNFASHCAYMDTRADFVLRGSGQSIEARYPEVDFAITTNDGEDFSLSASSVTLAGTGWVDVAQLTLAGDPTELPLSWLDGQVWEVELALEEGDNELELVALDLQGRVVGSDRITVTRR